MAFVPDITIADSTPTNQTFNLISTTGTKTVRKDGSREVDSPRIMTVSHEVSGKGVSAVDRHLVRFDQTEVDAEDDSSISTGSLHIVATVPRRNITSDHMEDLFAFMLNYLGVAGNRTKILNGEPG